MSEDIAWGHQISTAVRTAKEEKKLILIDFYRET